MSRLYNCFYCYFLLSSQVPRCQIWKERQSVDDSCKLWMVGCLYWLKVTWMIRFKNIISPTNTSGPCGRVCVCACVHVYVCLGRWYVLFWSLSVIFYYWSFGGVGRWNMEEKCADHKCFELGNFCGKWACEPLLALHPLVNSSPSVCQQSLSADRRKGIRISDSS